MVSHSRGIAAEPFMRVAGDMLDLEAESAQGDLLDAEVLTRPLPAPTSSAATSEPAPESDGKVAESIVHDRSDSPCLFIATDAFHLLGEVLFGLEPKTPKPYGGHT